MKGPQVRYQYSPLDAASKEIRLLRIVKTEPTDSIVLELRHTKLDRGDDFLALSYCWGEEITKHNVRVYDDTNVGTVSVRTNLFRFLEFACGPFQDWSNIWIWIDQICIDQGEDKERCHQVGLMGELYTAATATVIWPTSQDPETGSRLNLEHDDLSSDVLLFTTEELAALRVPENSAMKYPFGCRENTMEILSQLTYAMLSKLCLSPYWKRLWIIQEIVLASNSLVLVDDHKWALADLQDAISILLNNIGHAMMKTLALLRPKMEYLNQKVQRFLMQRRLVGHRRSEKQGGMPPGFYMHWDGVIGFSRDAECSIQLDRIYGLMGLLIDESLRIDPDYTIPQIELLRRVLEAQLKFSAEHLDGEEVRSVWQVLHSILAFAYSVFGLESTHAVGGIIMPSSMSGLRKYPERWAKSRVIAQHNSRILLRKFRIPIPVQITDLYGLNCNCEYDLPEPTSEASPTPGDNNPSAIPSAST